MISREEILKPIWHAFTALDMDQNGKVSKSQLKVLSHNLCTVLNIPHNSSALEEHFKDNDEGPVSTQGYMPYLNSFILSKIQPNFNFVDLNKMCWTLCAPKHISGKHLLISGVDAFKIWSIFNFLSEEKYPLHIVPEEIEGFLRKLLTVMGCSWNERRFEEYKMSSKKQELNGWELIELVGMGHFTKGMNPQTISIGINEIYQELILDVIKQSLPEKDGKKNLYIIRCVEKSFEINASDKKTRQEWIQAIQDCIVRIRQGLSSPQREARQKRREQRKRMRAEQETIENRMRQLQLANETKQAELEAMNKARKQMEVQVVEKSSELEQYWQRTQELEEMYSQLKEALEDERQAKQDEEALRKVQTRLLREEANKRLELEDIYKQQQQVLSQSQKEKEVLEKERSEKERSLQAAREQLEILEKQRQGAQEDYKAVTKKLERAANKTKKWKHRVGEHEGLIRLIQPANKSQNNITNWGTAAFTEAELDQIQKNWQENKHRQHEG
ncbi:Switch-associated protein 70 [Triplophysa tibetana]|uniref:Switch-associated protein 70 n=1 Tax=Triplophysa tibetana TaxID=1572043 RepID=A0A5A9PNN4_9TELE|nr:Switch-associated protein 70 [Triplophysa tibetana]